MGLAPRRDCLVRPDLRHVEHGHPAREFFAWIAAHVFTDPEAFRKFAVFWGLSWFVIIKGWHATEYAILYGVLKAALDRIAPGRPRRNLVVALSSCLLFAVSDEYHQTFVPGRNGTGVDVAIDGLGAGLAAWIASVRQSHPRRRTP